MNYYNEIDPFAAAWIRELIKAGHIPAGHVDERSIEDVTPAELAGYTSCHFFAGIAGWPYALRLAGWPDDRPVWTGSCPCQPFSQTGKGAGFADQRHLWPAWYHLISQCLPGTVLGEQVASPDGLGWLDLVQADLEAAGYAIASVDYCAAGVKAPGIRQRLWFVAESAQGRCEAGMRDAGNEVTERSRGAEPVGCFAPISLANAGRDGRVEGGLHVAGGPAPHDQGPADRNRDGRAAGLVANTVAIRHANRDAGSRHEAGRTRPRAEGLRCGDAVLMADADPERLPSAPRARVHDAQHHAESRSGMGDAAGTGLEGQSDQRSDHGEELPTAERAGGESDPWTGADWIWCQDERWRPVEPGTFPLAHGVPGRVGRLRGYGNAINPYVAARIIRAYMDLHA